MDQTGSTVGEIEVTGARPGRTFEFTVADDGLGPFDAPGPGGGTRSGFVGAVGLGRTLDIQTNAIPGTYQVSISIRFTLDELAAHGARPEELEVHVLDEGASPFLWVPAGANQGPTPPTGVAGHSGYTVDSKAGTATFWVIRTELSIYAVGSAGRVLPPPAVPGPTEPPPPAPTPDGGAPTPTPEPDGDQPADGGSPPPAGGQPVPDTDTDPTPDGPVGCAPAGRQAMALSLLGLVGLWRSGRRRRG